MVLLILVIGAFAILNKQYSYIQRYENARILKSVKISDIYDTLKSGDIILYKCNGLSISGLLSNIYYTHIGIVVKYDDNANYLKNHNDNYLGNCSCLDVKYLGNSNHRDLYKSIPLQPNKKRLSDLYISETNPAFEYLPRDHNPNNWYGLRPHLQKAQHDGWITNYGSDILPLLIRLKYYPGDCFIMRLNKELTPERKQLLEVCVEEKCPYPTPIQGLKILSEKKILKQQKTYARHCFQHVAHLLDQINITNNMLSSNGVISICNELGYIDGKVLNNGYQYETPIKIIYDI
jgi:hypothetical protein